MKEQTIQDGRLDALRRILFEGAFTVEKVGEVLPDAIRARIRKDDQFAKSLEPLISDVLERSVSRHKEQMVTALYPLLGAMIRKYVVETFRTYIKSLNSTIDRAFSIEGLQWRLEAKRTGVPIAEIALKHSLLYRVEHIFLIHNKNSQSLCHVGSPEAVETDQLAFSGMVGAITDFVQETFRGGSPIGLKTIEVSGFSVWFEEGPEALVAVVVRGDPPSRLRFKLKEVSEQLHKHYSKELRQGLTDEISLLGYESALREVLLEEPRTQALRKKYVGKAVLASAAALIALVVGFMSFRAVVDGVRDRNFADYIARLNKDPSVVLAHYGKERNGRYFVSGLVTSGAGALPATVEDFGLDPSRVDFRWINRPVLVDHSRNNLQLQNYFEGLQNLDGTALTEINANEVADLIGELYVQGRGLGRTFIVNIEHEPKRKDLADKWAGHLAWRLHLNGIYQPWLVRTHAKKDSPMIVRVLPERTETM